MPTICLSSLERILITHITPSSIVLFIIVCEILRVLHKIHNCITHWTTHCPYDNVGYLCRFAIIGHCIRSVFIAQKPFIRIISYQNRFSELLPLLKYWPSDTNKCLSIQVFYLDDIEWRKCNKHQARACNEVKG